MRVTWWRLLLAGLALVLVSAVGAPVAAATEPAGLEVTGAVATPAHLTVADLAGRPQVTLPSPGGPVTGVDLRELVLASAPVLPAGKNPQLRVLLTVTGRGHDGVFALGELDPDFGAHPALLTVDHDRIRLVVPGDRSRARTLVDVTRIEVGVVEAAPDSPPPGAVVVSDGHRTRTITADQLNRLPARTVTVDFQSGAGPQTHTERGPALALVLAAAGLPVGPDTAVAAVGSDGYLAAVTLGEAWFGGRPLLLSTVEDGVPLAQPRLVTDGDVKGGRYVSDVVTIVVRS